MALFTNKIDLASLPLITQFYQLEFTEIRAWVYLQIQKWEKDCIANGTVWRSVEGLDRVESGNPRYSDKSIQAGLVNEERWSEIQHFRNLLSGLMDNAVDYTPPHQSELDTLQAFSLRVAEAELGNLVWVTMPGHYYSIAPDPGLVTWEELLYKPILDEFYKGLKERLFKRCEECNSVFLMQKTEQKYCSQRCRHRHGQRIRMRELFKK